MFLIEALLWSRKSHDPQTQCGCVIVKDQTVISTGYNGFIRDIDDKVLANTRPAKYNFMIHAEINAIINCARQGKSTIGSTIYVTGQPCNTCLQYIWQAGILRIVYSDFSRIHMVNDEQSIAIHSQILKLMNPDSHPRMLITYVPASRIDRSILAMSLNRFDDAAFDF